MPRCEYCDSANVTVFTGKNGSWVSCNDCSLGREYGAFIARFVLAWLLLCSVSLGQIKVEVRQILTGVSGLETIEGQTFVAAESKPVVESVGFVDLGKIPAKPQVLRVRVTDKDRKPVTVERLTDSQYLIRGEGRVWVDARVTDLPSQFLLDEETELVLPPKALPEPVIPVPTDEVEKAVFDAINGIRKGYGTAFKTAARAIERREITVDSKLQSFLEPLTRTARTNALAGVDALIDAKIPRDVDKLRPEAAKFIESIGLAFEKGAK